MAKEFNMNRLFIEENVQKVHKEDLLDFLLILTVELIYVHEALPLGLLFCSRDPVQGYLNHGGVKHILISDRASFCAVHIVFSPCRTVLGRRQGAGLSLLRGSGSSGASRTRRWKHPRLLSAGAPHPTRRRQRRRRWRWRWWRRRCLLSGAVGPEFWEVDHRGSCCDLCLRVFCLAQGQIFLMLISEDQGVSRLKITERLFSIGLRSLIEGPQPELRITA
ncbi:uncharacterized protein LOC105605487 [Ovis aries]|uniref:uncharacterized protein LOC105605487 n=1 Tax=Ovis aries TaxID=9940 RepID=UPI00295262E7|nr:uncharacterized protein LOC105605487 [Ovis aries]